MRNLDLYARIEPMIGFYEAYERLYADYLQILHEFREKIGSVLDVGCGNGIFLQKLTQRYRARGIDISEEMVAISRRKGLDVECISLHEVAGKYDVITAVADVLNYMDRSTLQQFLEDVAAHLNPGGIFICDINTLHGFEDVAAGSMNVDHEDRFLGIDARFEEKELITDIVYFEKSKGACFHKEKATIVQYYYEMTDILSLSPIKMIKYHDVCLFSDEPDKTILVLRK